MDPRSHDRRRAGALFALLSVLVVSLAFAFPSSTEAARRDAAASAAALHPALAQADTTFDGFIAIGTDPDPACWQQPVAITFRACQCNVELVSADTAPDGVPRVRAIIRPGHLCIQCDPASMSVGIGVLAAGHHTITIERNLTFIYPDSTIDSVSTRNWFAFDVVQDCPPPTGIRYLTTVVPGHPSACTTCPPEACPNDSIPLLLRGVFPTPCHRVREVRLLGNPIASPLPAPPLVEIVYARNSCLGGGQCPPVFAPWETRLHLPPLPPNPPGAAYSLLVTAVLEDDCAQLPPEPMGNGAFAFVVVESCSTSTPNACFNASFAHGTGGCDATYGGEKPAEATFLVQTRVPLAGLQGTLHLDSPALMISGISAIGVAQGMTLQWTREGNGARFVLFAEHGAPIFDPTDVFPPRPMPVLQVEVEPNPLVDAPIPPRALLIGRELIGSDEAGRGVFPCPQITRVYPTEPYAWLCLAAPCDHNGDGAADVRDLVLLTRCVQGQGPCPDPITGMDCDNDGGLDLDDVMCCARVVLGLPAPDSLNGRPEPAITIDVDAPVRQDDGTIEVAVRMGGTDFLGASRLELRYPWLRYELAGIVAPSNPRWLPVSQDQGGTIALGLIAIQPKLTQDIGSERWVVRLRLRDGQSPGGSVSLTNAQFSGPDGVGLTTNVRPHGVPLGPQSSLALTPPRPNPFVGVTEFSIQLDDPSDLEIGVFDIAGRRVATLYKGLAPAGANVFRWTGRLDSGEPASSGVYFVRAWSGAMVASRKVLFVPANLRYSME